jgi:hypothetical protein
MINIKARTETLPPPYGYIQGQNSHLTQKSGEEIFLNLTRAFCKTKIFVQNQGMREILPQAYG